MNQKKEQLYKLRKKKLQEKGRGQYYTVKGPAG